MNLLFVSPLEDGAYFQRAVIVDLGRQRTEDERAFSDEPRGMSQPDFTRSPFFLLPTLPLTFSPCVVGSYTLSLWGFAPAMPSHLSSFKTHHHLSIPPLCLSVFASVSYFFTFSYPPRPLSLCPSLETCARYSCVNDGKSMWQCPATTNTHPCQLMTLRGIPRCPSPWLPG